MESFFLPNTNKYEINTEEFPTAGQVLDQFYLDYNITDHFDALAIWIIAESNNGSSESLKKSQLQTTKLRLQLKGEHKLKDVKQKTKQMFKNDDVQVKFKISRNGFYSILKEEKLDNPILLEFLYLEAKDNVSKNIYPFFEKRIDLFGIEYQVEQIKRSQKEPFCVVVIKKWQTIQYTNSMRKLKNKKIILKRAKTLGNKFQQSNDQSNELKLYQEYLKICREYQCYGGFFFEGQMERSIRELISHRLRFYDKQVIVAINDRGLHIVNIECPKIMFTIPFKDLYYGIQYPKKENHFHCLYILVEKVNQEKKFKQIFTKHASFIDKVLEQFAQRNEKIQCNSVVQSIIVPPSREIESEC